MGRDNKPITFTVIQKETTNEIAYRYYDALEGYTDWTRVKVYLQEFRIIKKTPKGFWIDSYFKKKFVLLNARKKYACFTKEEALESFMARKERQIRILENQLSHARQALGSGEEIKARIKEKEKETNGEKCNAN